MRFHRIYILLYLLVISMWSCIKEYSYEGGTPETGSNGGNEQVTVKSEWQFKEDSLYFGPVDTAFLIKENNGQTVTIKGRSSSGEERLTIKINSAVGNLQKGKTYSTLISGLRFLYTRESDSLYLAMPYMGGDIHLTITDIDSTKITGNFQGIVLDEKSKSLRLTEGRFSSPLKKIADSQAKGYLMLWAKEDCNGPVRVKVGELQGEISAFSAIPPRCSDQGRPTYNLPPGTYRWVAYCGRDSVYGNAEVKAGYCTSVMVEFPFRPPMVTETSESCVISNVRYSGCLFFACILPGKPQSNDISASYSGRFVNALTFTVLIGPAVITRPRPVTYNGNKTIIDEGTSYEQYFETDNLGRVIAFHGFAFPDILYPNVPVHITYEYVNNNLTKRTTFNSDRQAIFEMQFIWQDGNVVKVINKHLLSGLSNEVRYEYYTDKEINALPFTFTGAMELVMFQAAIRFGNHMKNPLKNEIQSAVDYRGNPVINTYNFNSYILDNNNYVLQFRESDSFGTNSIFSFNYRCF